MQIFVVIATHARQPLLARTLATLAACRIPDGFGGTLVVENGGRGGTEGLLREAPAVLRARYLFEPAGNKCRALNAALSTIDDGLVVFLDDDVRVEPALLEAYAAAARRMGPGHFFGGPILPDYEDPPPEWLMPFLPASARPWQPDEASLGTKPFFLGFNWAAFVADLRRAGGFDERLGPGTFAGVGDESDLQRRLHAAGARALSVPAALVHHWVPRARCSPGWALDRAHRLGIRRGMQKAADATGPAIAGYPLSMVRSVIGSWLRARWPGRRQGGPAERFAAEAQYRRQLGVLRGVRFERQAEPGRQGPWVSDGGAPSVLAEDR
jgi:GT2 family glycosyltransferase